MILVMYCYIDVFMYCCGSVPSLYLIFFLFCKFALLFFSLLLLSLYDNYIDLYRLDYAAVLPMTEGCTFK